VAEKPRQTLFDPTLLPEDQESLEFLNNLTELEKTILEARTMHGIRLISEFRGLPFSQVARHAIKGAVALKKFQ
jgi:hypothetical protein